jgi:hypothetical protein
VVRTGDARHPLHRVESTAWEWTPSCGSARHRRDDAVQPPGARPPHFPLTTARVKGKCPTGPRHRARSIAVVGESRAQPRSADSSTHPASSSAKESVHGSASPSTAVTGQTMPSATAAG